MKKYSKRKYISNKIISGLPKNLDELETAAYIMMKIAYERSFSSEYYWGEKRTMRKIYSESIKKNNLKLMKRKQLICVTAARLFKEIAGEAGLNICFLGKSSKKITNKNISIFENGEHIIPILKTKDGKLFEVDVEKNLDNIKTHRRWTNFCTNVQSDKLSTVSDKKIECIMKKIGYIKEKDDYLDEYCENLFKELTNLTILEKVRRIFTDERLKKCANELKSSAEIFRFYRKILSESTTKKDGTNEFNKNIKLLGGYAKDKNSKKRFIICCFVNDEDREYAWVWSRSKMTEVESNMIKNFIKQRRIKIKLVRGYDSSFIKFCDYTETNEKLNKDIWTR